MKINKFTKNRNGMYIITFEDNSKIKIHEDLILKYDLLISKSLDDDLKEKILSENKTYEIYEVAISYINKKLRSKKELINYLKKKEYSSEDIGRVVLLLTDSGFLNNDIYANSFVHDHIVLSMDGPNKIRKELEDNGIDNDLIYKVMENYTLELEMERIEKIVDKQIKLNKNKGANLLKKKIQMYLLNLGYNIENINKVLNFKKLDSEDLYKKEYEKAYNKLSKKYDGKELEYKLKQYMYQKGFSYNDYE